MMTPQEMRRAIDHISDIAYRLAADGSEMRRAIDHISDIADGRAADGSEATILLHSVVEESKTGPVKPETLAAIQKHLETT